jgi:aryl-alcohol dehydrogenase-like predicted oxidoreductase
MNGVKASLKRLGTDYIDLYQIHGTDPITPIEETVRAMEDLVRQGHVRYWGISNWQAWRIAKAIGVADKLDAAKPVTLQAYYTIAGRDLEREIVPLLESEKLGLMVWSPLAGGFLSGKYAREGGGPNDARRVTFDFPPIDKARAFDCIDVMREIAGARGVSVARIALAYVLNKRFVMSVIIGAKNIEQLDDNLAATEIGLTTEEMARLDAVSALPAEYPGWMLTRQQEAQWARLAPFKT